MGANCESGSRIWLAAPAACLSSADVGFTLLGQPTTYWTDSYATVNEINPIAHFALSQGPGWFIGLGVTWVVLFSYATHQWRHPLSIGIAKGVTVAHSIGGACWLANASQLWIVPSILYIAAVGSITCWCWIKFECSIPKDRSELGL